MTKTKMILIVDDDQEDRELLEETIISLEPESQVVSLPNGKKTLEYLDDCPSEALPDVIILDYNMPKLTAADILLKIRQQEILQEIPVLVWSTSNAPSYLKACMEAGATEYLLKPTTSVQLKIVAQKVLDLCN